MTPYRWIGHRCSGLSQPAVIDLLAGAETVLQSTGQVVALCPSYVIESCTEDSDEY